MRERDFFKERLSRKELLSLLGATPPAEAFAWRSPRARAMGLDPSQPPPDVELLRMMLEVPYLLRRPAMRIGGRTVFGFDRARVEAALVAARG
ncbi:MAG: ArsC/Spx/MgsR family protein [Dehalococcoidia bacterium]|nr:ArsC/Spx/MgsR family protein [Dehalococcoidia bacterium]